MKRVRVTIHPQSLDSPTLYERLTEAPFLTRVQTVNWNIREPPAAFLLRLRGEYERLEPGLAADEQLFEYELLPVTDRECYLFLKGRAPAESRALWENFTRDGLLTVPPVEWREDGSSTFTIVGTEADVQAAVDGVPETVGIEVDRVGGDRVTPADAREALSPRQREAVEAALAVGYYEVPREATAADVAAAMGCTASTAGEHLQRAESAVLASLFGT
ncbi:helix-turn-helix domain-containing protein [Haloarchaeobius litoreus]|uniref:Helix-turn-helix domain-containing protein n=1 Tax=Haloarchaeobius litoreus TaxID=755306 RepID=A0ABD6DP52_9EURY|nr:helix-turn-helix domain-containing protein [Haloarchaeobius litoreus]